MSEPVPASEKKYPSLEEHDNCMLETMKEFIKYSEKKHGTVESERDAYKQLLLDISGGSWSFPVDFQQAQGGYCVLVSTTTKPLVF